MGHSRYQLVSRISSISSITPYLGVFPSVYQEITCNSQEWRQALAVFVDSWMMKFVTAQPCETLLWMYIWMICVQPNISEWRYDKYTYVYIYIHSIYNIIYAALYEYYEYRYVYIYICMHDISIIHEVSWHCGSLYNMTWSFLSSSIANSRLSCDA